MSDSAICQLRRQVLALGGHLEFEKSEWDKLLTDDQFAGMFLEEYNGRTQVSAAAILKAMVYRKKHRIYDIKAEDLPMDMIPWDFKVGQDTAGRSIVWNVSGSHRSIPELTDSMVKIFYWQTSALLNSCDRYDLYLDLRALSFKSIDMRLSRKMSSLQTHCFPGRLAQLFICGLPVALTAVVQTMVNMLPVPYVQKVTFLTLDQARARVAYLSYPPVAKGSTMRQVLHGDNVPQARVDKILETFNSSRQMAEQLFDELGL
ncbi:hypothetical protein HDE_01872 [Halotydeus destructor]|nr:hypothetical protein HDE_01872 [Halotydeus destructor]